jgi:hypothetical protein
VYSCKCQVFKYEHLQKFVPGLRGFDLLRKKYVVSICLCMRYEGIDFQKWCFETSPLVDDC